MAAQTVPRRTDALRSAPPVPGPTPSPSRTLSGSFQVRHSAFIYTFCTFTLLFAGQQAVCAGETSTPVACFSFGIWSVSRAFTVFDFSLPCCCFGIGGCLCCSRGGGCGGGGGGGEGGRSGWGGGSAACLVTTTDRPPTGVDRWWQPTFSYQKVGTRSGQVQCSKRERLLLRFN